MYKTDIESCEDVEMDGEISTDGGHFITKYVEQKKGFNTKNFKEKCEKMKYMLDCGFNLLVYGYGSKADSLNLFQYKFLNNEHVLIVRGFDTACSMKVIVDAIVTWLTNEVF